MLAMTFEFLNGVAYLDGRAAGRQGVAEYPPHPDRVFMALVATWGGANDEERAALEWLECAGSPSIVASESRDRPTLKVYSPGNDELNSYKDGQRNVDRRVSSTVPDHPRVTYTWDTDPPLPVRESIQALLARVHYLGRSESIVSAWLDEDDNTATWIPADKGKLMLRVTYSGRLAELVSAYDAGRRPTAAAWQAYRRSGTLFPSGEWETLWAYELDGPADLRHTVKLARAVRACMLAACPDPVPAWVSGHDNDGDRLRDSHIGIVPLANVGHQHSDGRVLGIALTIPKSSDITDRFRCLGDLFAKPQRIADSVYVHRIQSSAATLDPDRWCGPSRSWGTVTPIACHRWPKGDVERVVEANVAHAGLPRPEAIEVRATSPFVGGLFGAPIEAPSRYRTHAVIHWAEPVRGPVVIGAGRYMGLGFCRGMD